MIDFDDGPLATAQRQLAALDLRAKVVLHNIANQNTPGYKRYYVSFEERLREASQSGEARRVVEPQVLRDESGPPGINNVSVIDEQGTLEKVRLLSDLVSRQIGGQFNKLNRAISGR